MGQTATTPVNHLRIGAGALALPDFGLGACATTTTNKSMPGIGSDMADPEVEEVAYKNVPLKQLQPLSNDGPAPTAGRYGELTMPILIFYSINDVVVPPESSAHLRDAAGGEVEFMTLERSFSVATQDLDRDVINERSLAFIERVTSRS